MKALSILKVLGSISVGSGVSYGGFELYQYLYPKTLREILEKEGVKLLSTKGNDEEWERVWNAYAQMSNAETLKQYCETELKKTNNRSAKQQVTEYCSLKGIENVSQIISYSKKTKITKDEMKDEDYQLVFLIYTSEFSQIEENKGKLSLLEWLQKSDSGITEAELKSAKNLKEKGNLVKKACKKIENKLEKQKDDEEYESIYWWCTKIENKEFFEANTIDKRIKYVDKTWELADDWEKVYKDWEKMKFKDEDKPLTEAIEDFLNLDPVTKLTRSTNEKENFKDFCEKDNIKNKKLVEDTEPYDSQKNLYMLYKAICRKRPSDDNNS